MPKSFFWVEKCWQDKIKLILTALAENRQGIKLKLWAEIHQGLQSKFSLLAKYKHESHFMGIFDNNFFLIHRIIFPNSYGSKYYLHCKSSHLAILFCCLQVFGNLRNVEIKPFTTTNISMAVWSIFSKSKKFQNFVDVTAIWLFLMRTTFASFRRFMQTCLVPV